MLDCTQLRSVFRFGADRYERGGPCFRAKSPRLQEMTAFQGALGFREVFSRGIGSRSLRCSPANHQIECQVGAPNDAIFGQTIVLGLTRHDFPQVRELSNQQISETVSAAVGTRIENTPHLMAARTCLSTFWQFKRPATPTSLKAPGLATSWFSAAPESSRQRICALGDARHMGEN
jgi:hypothetical protein